MFRQEGREIFDNIISNDIFTNYIENNPELSYEQVLNNFQSHPALSNYIRSEEGHAMYDAMQNEIIPQAADIEHTNQLIRDLEALMFDYANRQPEGTAITYEGFSNYFYSTPIDNPELMEFFNRTGTLIYNNFFLNDEGSDHDSDTMD